MYGFIYITTNLINGKKYLGQRKYDRNWERYLGSGVLIKQAIEKFGEENFKREIIAEAETRDELNQLEIKLIEEYGCITDDNWYNVHFGGVGGALPGTLCHNYGRVQTEEHKKRISEGMKKTITEKGTDGWKGRTHTQETKRKFGKPFHMINMKTGEKKVFHTKKECATETGLKEKSIYYCLWHKKQMRGTDYMFLYIEQ